MADGSTENFVHVGGFPGYSPSNLPSVQGDSPLPSRQPSSTGTSTLNEMQLLVAQQLTGEEANIRQFTNIRQFNIRETEQTLNVMCVGEAGMGKSTYCDAFFKTYRDQEEVGRLAGEESHRVQEKKQELTRHTNTMREARERIARLGEEDKLVEAAEEKERIVKLEEEDRRIRAEIETLRAEDRAQRDQLEATKSEIIDLTFAGLMRDVQAALRRTERI